MSDNPPASHNLTIDGARLWDSLHEMAKIGATEKGGCNRQTLTDLDRDGRDLFARWCRDAGMTVAVDSMGNMFARRQGTDGNLDPIAVGSHLDTQPTGGKYDGVLGVLAGLELVRTLNDLDVKTRRPIEIINWTNEEGARFAPAMLASGVYAGVFEERWAKEVHDGEGLGFGDELSRIGYEGAEAVGERKFHAFFELHIEQGPILEAEDCDIGVVTHGQGLRWLEVTLIGKESHTGTTPMARRQDALLGAAAVIGDVERIARDCADDAVASVGHIVVAPNSRNIIPGQVRFCADLRHRTQEGVDAMTAELSAAVARVATERGLTSDIATVGEFAPVTFDGACVEMVRGAASSLDLSHRDIISGAGHDACYIARVTPTAMVFCPCVDGLSHNEAEAIKPEWATAGANVLMRAALEAAEVVG